MAYNNFNSDFFCFFSLVTYSFKEKDELLRALLEKKKPHKFSICVAFAIIQKDVFALSLFYLFVC